MKRLIIICIFIVISAITVNRQSYADSNLSDLLKDKVELNYWNIDKLHSQLRNDIYEYYGLSKTYDTDLKKKMFSSTDEYKDKANQLKISNDEVRSKKHFISLKAYDFYKNRASNYLIDKKGFLILTEESEYMFSNSPYLIEYATFSSLPFNVKKSTDHNGYTTAYMSFFIEANEEQGLKIENNKDNIKIIIAFNIKGASPKHYKVLIADCPVQVYFVNDKTGEIYIEKTFGCPENKIKPVTRNKKR